MATVDVPFSFPESSKTNSIKAVVNLAQIGTGISRAAINKVSKSNAAALLASFYEAQKDITTAIKNGEHVAEYGSLLNSTKVIENQAKEAFGEDWLAGVKKAANELEGVGGVSGAGIEILTIGKKGINNALAKGYTNIDNYIASSDYASDLVSDFAKYQSKGGSLSLEKYTVKHKTITQNRLKGSAAEEVFQDLEGGIVKKTGIQTADGTFRYIDNILNGTGREIKSGFISNTTSVRKQIIDDLDIIKNQRSLDVQRMEWHCFEGVDPQLINWVKSEMTRLQIPFEKFKFVTYK